MSIALAPMNGLDTHAGTPSFVPGLPFPKNARSNQAYVVAACGEMDRQFDGKISSNSYHWSLSAGPRVRQIVHKIVAHAKQNRLDHVHVLNMSGLNGGKPDPILYDLIEPQVGSGKLSWQIVDHPLSHTFGSATVRSWLDARGMMRIGQDFRDPDFKVPEATADIVLCTEIIEHLDYTVTTRLLRSCWHALRPGGILIITTPNAVFLEHRIRFALGQWDFLHFMDAPDDVERGLLGHIMYWDGRRASRLLKGLDFTQITVNTFNAGHGPGEHRNILTKTAARLLHSASHLVPNSKQVLLVSAQRPAA